jgi:hypothetical protein
MSLRIHYKRRSDLAVLLALALMTAAFLCYLAWGYEEVAASSPQAPRSASDGLREYYLTKGTYGGANASTACADGYHMASLWEIMDPSNLFYNTSLGFTWGDSGHGPSYYAGWVRTGYDNDNSGPTGQSNCNGWSTTTGGGTTANLPSTWDAGWQEMHVWNVVGLACNNVARVWCVEDEITFNLFLPLVLRDF